MPYNSPRKADVQAGIDEPSHATGVTGRDTADPGEEAPLDEDQGPPEEGPVADVDACELSVSEFQAPARMASPKASGDETAAVDALVGEGVSREQAEELVKTHGVNWDALKASAFAGDA